MQAFHTGRLNMLFTTRVGAEGLDFGNCGLVCLCSLPTHVQDYLQCRCAPCAGVCVARPPMCRITWSLSECIA